MIRDLHDKGIIIPSNSWTLNVPRDKSVIDWTSRASESEAFMKVLSLNIMLLRRVRFKSILRLLTDLSIRRKNDTTNFLVFTSEIDTHGRNDFAYNCLCPSRLAIFNRAALLLTVAGTFLPSSFDLHLPWRCLQGVERYAISTTTYQGLGFGQHVHFNWIRKKKIPTPS
jgi:hypothetical protein